MHIGPDARGCRQIDACYVVEYFRFPATTPCIFRTRACLWSRPQVNILRNFGACVLHPHTRVKRRSAYLVGAFILELIRGSVKDFRSQSATLHHDRTSCVHANPALADHR
jgi:hypothetical protein